MCSTPRSGQKPNYTDHYFIISEMIYKEKNRRIALEQLSIFLGKSFVLTIQEESERDVFSWMFICRALASARTKSCVC